MNTKRSTKPAGEFLNSEELGARWKCHPLTAKRRMQRFGIKPMRLSQRSALFHAADVVRIENLCS